MKHGDSKEDSVIIEAYNPLWPEMAEAEIQRVRDCITNDNLVDIQHVGSTSIPGAMAKPIIDLYISVHSIPRARDHYVSKLERLDYVFWADNPAPDKLFFVKGMPPYGTQRTHHIHVVEAGSGYWRDRLAFRDYLRQSADALDTYNALKIKLARQYGFDREGYTDAKSAFIKSILDKAGFPDGGER